MSMPPYVAVEADVRSAGRPQHIAMSFHPLFLSRLLPSRACLRFTGGADNTAPNPRVNFCGPLWPWRGIFPLDRRSLM